jgi:hypothetical protein
MDKIKDILYTLPLDESDLKELLEEIKQEIKRITND